MQDIESSESYEMRSVTSSEAEQQDNDLQPFVHNTISSNRKTLNVTG